MKNILQAGFTLLELMIVVAIVAILAAIAVPQFQKFSAKTRRAEGITLLKGLYTAEIAYFSTHDAFAHEDGNFIGPPPQLGFAAASPPKYYDLQTMLTMAGDFSTSPAPHPYQSFGALLEGQLDTDPLKDALVIGTITAPAVLYDKPGEVAVVSGLDDVNLE